MAQNVQVILTCDLCGGERSGTETVRFGLDSTSYEVDVCDKHGKALRERLATYTAAARRVARGGARRRGAASRPRDNRSGEIRAWARKKGIPVSERGRLSADLVAKYEARKK